MAKANGRHKARQYKRLLPDDARSSDPAQGVLDAPPNFSRAVIPQIITFGGMQSLLNRVYRNPDEALKHSVENAEIMRRDTAIMECLEARQRSTALLNWHLEVEDEDDDQQKRLAENLTLILERTAMFTEYRRNLLEALWYGRYAVQNMYGFAYRGGRRFVYVKDWVPINGDKLVFRYDRGDGKYTGREVGIKVGMGWNEDDVLAGRRKIETTDTGMAYFLEDWERSRLCIHKHIIEDGRYEDPLSAGRIHGVGVRDRIYWSWFQKQETIAQMMEIVGRVGGGWTIYHFPFGNEEARQAAENVAKNQNANNVILLPSMGGEDGEDQFRIERIEPSAAGIATMKELITEFFGWAIKRYIMGQVLTSEAQATGLGSGVADAHQDTYRQIIAYDAAKLEETLTTDLVDVLKRFNYPEFADVQVKFKIQVDDGEAEKKMAAFQQAWQMGAELSEQEVLDCVGASMPKPDERKLFNPQIVQQLRLAQQAGTIQNPAAAAQGNLQDMFGPLAGGEQAQPQAGAQQYAKQPKSSPGQIGLFGDDSPEPQPESVAAPPPGKPSLKDRVAKVAAQGFDEHKHPRQPQGEHGGEFAPTHHLPGTPEKLAVMQARVEAGHEPTHPDDATYSPQVQEQPNEAQTSDEDDAPGDDWASDIPSPELPTKKPKGHGDKLRSVDVHTQFGEPSAEPIDESELSDEQREYLAVLNAEESIPDLVATAQKAIDDLSQAFSLSRKPQWNKPAFDGPAKAKQVDLFAGRGDSPGQTSFFDDIDQKSRNVGALAQHYARLKAMAAVIMPAYDALLAHQESV